ncbi:ABC transporter ATP-binding protein [Aliikangiella maris]|uniref:ABC transporter ATP-binding protein n=2 Tax=Aliikangiella maris TaxID=3162458 RepID=A0ABV3MQZ9_9GAMM
MTYHAQNELPMLQVAQLCWQVKQKCILDNLSFTIQPGEFVGLIGPNGAGKSSLLRCLYGKHQATSGSIQLNGQHIQDYSRRALAQKIAVVLQEPSASFEMSVMDVIRMGLTPNKSLLAFDTPEDRYAIQCAAEKVDLQHKITQNFNSLSGGEKQRALIARAIIQSTDILIMDEPTNHLDVRHQVEVLELARELGITVIVSIHDLNLAAAFCDRLILLKDGQMIAQGSPEAVLTEQSLKQVFEVDACVDVHPFNQKLRITFALRNTPLPLPKTCSTIEKQKSESQSTQIEKQPNKQQQTTKTLQAAGKSPVIGKPQVMHKIKFGQVGFE